MKAEKRREIEHERMLKSRIRQAAKESEIHTRVLTKITQNTEAEMKRQAWKDGKQRVRSKYLKDRGEEYVARAKVREEHTNHTIFNRQNKLENLGQKWKETDKLHSSLYEDDQNYTLRRHAEIRDTNRARIEERRRKLASSCPFLSPAQRPSPPNGASTQRIRKKRTPRAVKEQPKTARVCSLSNPPTKHKAKHSPATTTTTTTTTTEPHPKPLVDPNDDIAPAPESTNVCDTLYTIFLKQVENCFDVTWPESRPPAHRASSPPPADGYSSQAPPTIGFEMLMPGYLKKLAALEEQMGHPHPDLFHGS